MRIHVLIDATKHFCELVWIKASAVNVNVLRSGSVLGLGLRLITKNPNTLILVWVSLLGL